MVHQLSCDQRGASLQAVLDIMQLHDRPLSLFLGVLFNTIHPGVELFRPICRSGCWGSRRDSNRPNAQLDGVGCREAMLPLRFVSGEENVRAVHFMTKKFGRLLKSAGV